MRALGQELAHETDNPHVDEDEQDAKVVALLLNVHNDCTDWREIHAEDDLKKFLIIGSLAMCSGYVTTAGVFEAGFAPWCHPNAGLHDQGQVQEHATTVFSAERTSR